MDINTMDIYMSLHFEDTQELCRICTEMPCEIDVKCGRYCVDGRSLLGVTAMTNHIVQLVPVTGDPDVVDRFYTKVKELGAYYEEN